ncbi:hypothetical protein FB465_1217 [Kitasatospora atroaurantiaca]|uniref:Uncharacterized protein n=1 Tax=Kitasatospora atroaurantiaca TaxID=285545 RepID=A0A561EKV7_9ACTN|nr:hypothetical protein FB465_1217 [Kitasatospora atroaurantiaca]
MTSRYVRGTRPPHGRKHGSSPTRSNHPRRKASRQPDSHGAWDGEPGSPLGVAGRCRPAPPPSSSVAEPSRRVVRVEVRCRSGPTAAGWGEKGGASGERARPRPDVIVVLTDGQTPWPSTRPPCRTVVGLLPRQRAARSWDEDDPDFVPDSPPAWARAVDIGSAPLLGEPPQDGADTIASRVTATPPASAPAAAPPRRTAAGAPCSALPARTAAAAATSGWPPTGRPVRPPSPRPPPGAAGPRTG